MLLWLMGPQATGSHIVCLDTFFPVVFHYDQLLRLNFFYFSFCLISLDTEMPQVIKKQNVILKHDTQCCN